MPRTITRTFPHDTSSFTPTQVQPQVLLGFAMSAWASWSEHHLVSFPRLVREFGVGLVVVGAELHYLRPHGFFDADELSLVLGMRVHDSGRIVAGHVEYSSAGGPFARLFCPCRPVVLRDKSLAAEAVTLPEPILSRFAADEIRSEALDRQVPKSVAAFDDTPSQFEHETKLRILRHHCELADQWSFSQLPTLVNDAREAGLDGAPGPFAAVRGMGHASFELELVAPAYIYDECRVRTRGQTTSSGVTFVHDFYRCGGSGRRLATVVERFAAPARA